MSTVSRAHSEHLTLGSDLGCLPVFQISTSASPAPVSTGCAATWRAPSTASAHSAANWTPPTPSAWVRHPLLPDAAGLEDCQLSLRKPETRKSRFDRTDPTSKP